MSLNVFKHGKLTLVTKLIFKTKVGLLSKVEKLKTWLVMRGNK